MTPHPTQEGRGLDREQLRLRHERQLRLMAPAPAERLRALSLFSFIPEKARDKVIEKVRRYTHLMSIEAGETILREGDYSDTAYFVVEGSARVAPAPRPPQRLPVVRGGAQQTRPRERNPAVERMLGRPVVRSASVSFAALPTASSEAGERRFGPGEIFGETSALSRYPVLASVLAETRLTLLLIRLPGLRMLIAGSREFKQFLDARYRERTLAHHLLSVPLLAELDAATLQALKQRAELLSFAPGQLIFEEGAPADGLYLVRGGYVKLSVRTGDYDLAVSYLRKGDYAGEAALLVDEPWPFALQALEHVELVRLARADFMPLARRNPVLLERLWAEMTARLKVRGAALRNPVASQHLQMAMETGLIHGESVLLIDLSTCTHCDECVRGCADAHAGMPRFIREGQRHRNWLVPIACYQCTDPVCMIDCPTGAITRSASTLEVTIDRDTCIGCSNCANRCPWGNIVMVEAEERRPDGRPVEIATKCDLCLDRAEGPACVQMCPHGSAIRISFKDIELVTSTLR